MRVFYTSPRIRGYAHANQVASFESLGSYSDQFRRLKTVEKRGDDVCDKCPSTTNEIAKLTRLVFEKHARVMVTVQLSNEIKEFVRNEIDGFRF